MGTKHPKRTIVSGSWNGNCCSRSKSASRWSSESASRNAVPSYSSLSDDAYSSEEEEEPRRTTIISKTEAPPGIFKHACPSCYCRDFPVPPLLFCSENRSDRCTCRRPSSNEVHSVFLKYAPEKLRGYTKRRQNYESVTKDYFVDFRKHLARLEGELYGASKTPSMAASAVDVSEVGEFRRSNYLLCHSNPKSAIPCQSCLHKFTLNEQLKAVPQNADVNGVSRCVRCNKPVFPEDVPLPMDRPCSSATTNFSFNSSKATIRTCSSGRKDRHSIQLDVPEGLQEKNGGRRWGRAPPTNTMALRYQKGVY